ncbi:hypothetical protein Tco_0999429 [Tanacetum coccineum]
MVAYLKKPIGSEGFQKIVDFLNDSYIRYALTKNPTIYVFLIKKFWQTATIRTVDNGEQEITAIVDGKDFTITEASVRRHLQLTDVDGISVLPTTEIFDQLSLMRYVSTDDKLTFQKGGSPRCQEAMGGSIAQTTSKRVPTQSYDSPLLRIHTLGSDEGSMILLKLTVLCITLSKKVESLKADLKQTKKVYGAIYTKLNKKVKKLEKIFKSNQARRRAKIVVSDDEEDSYKQGRMIEEINQDAGVTLVTPTHTKENVHTYTRRRMTVSTGSGGISTASRSYISIPSPVIVKDKGKGKMEEYEDEQSKRTKLQKDHERLGHEVAVRLQEELDEE